MMSSQRKTGSTLLVPVFVPAVLVTVLLIIGTVANPARAGEAFSAMLAYVTETFGWFYMLAVAVFLVFIVTVAFSRFGRIKLGPDHAMPQYSFPAWFAMLFSAGYGIALLFFGVAEPVLHYAAPPQGAPETIEAARQAMQIAFFHWGFHIWAIYGLVGVVLAYFSFRHGLPLSMRSALYPLIGERIHGGLGHAVDVFAILGTLFGISTTLGLSVTQLNAGMHYLWPAIPVSTGVQVSAIAVISGIALLSVVAGLDKGVKRLSIVNMVLAVALLTFVFVAGPSVFILETFLQNTGSYLNNIVARTFNLEAYSGSDWIGNWTLFIFAWTIAWAPFVGLFIAKISRGRTIRQFVIGVMLVPSLFTFLWFSVFGSTALHLIMVDGYTALIGQVQADHALALFQLYGHYPFTALASFLTVVLIVTFFVTSSDSGSLVIDSLASGGRAQTPLWQRSFWAITQGAVAAVLLVAGGLKALQAMAIASALPFALIMLAAVVGLWRALIIEGHREVSLQTHMHRRGAVPGQWKQRLQGLMSFPGRQEVSDFITGPVLSAMEHVQRELVAQGWPAEVVCDANGKRAYLEVVKPGHLDFIYDIRLRDYLMPGYAYPELDRSGDSTRHYYHAEVFLRHGGQSYDIYGYDRQQVIDDILDQFGKYLHFLHITPGNLPWNMQAHDEMLNEDVPERLKQGV